MLSWMKFYFSGHFENEDDNIKKYKATDYSVIKGMTKTKFTKRFGDYSSDYSIKASVNSDNEIYARIKLDLDYGNVDKKVFRKIVEYYQPMLPKNFIQFDLDSVLQNFGTLKLRLETIFSGRGLKNIFSKILNIVRIIIVHIIWRYVSCLYNKSCICACR